MWSADHQWSTDIFPGGSQEKGISLSFNDINTQTDQFWQIFMTQFTVVVRDRGTKFISGP